MGCFNSKLEQLKSENQFWANDLAFYDAQNTFPSISVSSLLGPNNGKVFYEHAVQPEGNGKKEGKRITAAKPVKMKKRTKGAPKTRDSLGVIELQDPEDVRAAENLFDEDEEVLFLAEDAKTHVEGFVPNKNGTKKKGRKKKKNNEKVMEGEGLWLADEEDFMSSIRQLENKLASSTKGASPASAIHFASSTWGDAESPLHTTKELLDELMYDGGYGNPCKPTSVTSKNQKLQGKSASSTTSPLTSLGAKFPQTASLLREKSHKGGARHRESPLTGMGWNLKYPQTANLLRQLDVPVDQKHSLEAAKRNNSHKRRKMRELLDEYSNHRVETPPQPLLSSASPCLSSFSTRPRRASSRARTKIVKQDKKQVKKQAESLIEALNTKTPVAPAASSEPEAPTAAIPPAPPLPAHLSSSIPVAPPLPPLAGSTSSSSDNSAQAHTKKAKNSGRKLKKFHWEKVQEGSGLWAELDQGKQLPVLDFSDLEEKFGQCPGPSTQKMKNTPAGRRKGRDGSNDNESKKEVEVPSLVASKRAYNIEITFARFKLSLKDLRSAVLSIDSDILTADRLEALAKFAPTREEVALIKGYKGDISKHGFADRYINTFKDVPNVEERLGFLYFQSTFETHARKVEEALDTVAKACMEVKNNKNIKDILYVILQIGNRMNSDEAKGFSLSSLGRLTSTKGTGDDRNFTLLQFLVSFLHKNFPATLKLSEELPMVKRAALIEPQFVQAELREFGLQLKKLEQELQGSTSNRKNSSPEGSLFRTKMPPFAQYASGRYEALKCKYRSVNQLSQELAGYFGEPSLTWNQFFALWVSFLTNFDRSVKKMHEQHAREKRVRNRRNSVRSGQKTKKPLPKKEEGTFGVLDQIKALRKDGDENTPAPTSLLPNKSNTSSTLRKSSKKGQDKPSRATPLTSKRMSSLGVNSPRKATPQKPSMKSESRATRHLNSLLASSSNSPFTSKHHHSAKVRPSSRNSRKRSNALWGNVLDSPASRRAATPMRSPRALR